MSRGSDRTQFLYDGDHVVAEYDGSTGALKRRYYWGPGADEPILQDEGGAMDCSGTRFLHTDERGSVVGIADCSGNRIQTNRYDEFGRPASENWGRFTFTGQAWLPEIGLYYYKARMYSPMLGRFMQTDPIGYGDGLNMYDYVGGDPVNFTDPSGQYRQCDHFTAVYTLSDGSSYTVVNDPRYTQCHVMPDPVPSQDPGFTRGRPTYAPGGNAAPAVAVTEQRTPCSPPAGSLVGAARLVVGKTQNVIDGLVVASAASGIGEPLAAGLTVLNDVFEVGLLGVNAYDAFVNGDSGSLKAQAAALPVRLLPAGRLLQSGLKGARGPTGILRNARGQFRSSYLNNPGVREAGQTGAEKAAGAAAESVTCAAR